MLNSSDYYVKLPSPIASLDEIAPELRENYRPHAGAYVLTQAAKDEIARCNAAMDEQIARDNAELAAHDALIAGKDKFIADRVIDGALGDALIEAGTQPKLARAAAALLKSEWAFEMDDAHAVRVTIDGQTSPIAHAVSTWLASDAGQMFSEQKPEQRRGRFAQLFARA